MERARALLDKGRPDEAVEVLTEALLSADSLEDSENKMRLLLAGSEAHLRCSSAAAARCDACEALRAHARLARAWLLKAAALRAEGEPSSRQFRCWVWNFSSAVALESALAMTMALAMAMAEAMAPAPAGATGSGFSTSHSIVI